MGLRWAFLRGDAQFRPAAGVALHSLDRGDLTPNHQLNNLVEIRN
jgi:hypothetical protein